LSGNGLKPLPPKEPVGELVFLCGGEVDEVSVSLRFFGDDLDPDTITSLLMCEPTTAYRKGDTITGTKYDRVAKTGAWMLNGKWNAQLKLEEQIHALFDRLSNAPEVWRQLTTRYDSDLFCGLSLHDWNRGLELSPEVMKRISERGIALNLDIYFTDDE
jgi:hypothetical protein